MANAIKNNALEALGTTAPKNVLRAIRSASTKTGVDFAYMLNQAKTESSFKADAKAKTSSASGLYQFIERTWMSMIDKHGTKHGIQTEGKSREEILEMRNDPETASLMAAELAADNKNFLETHWAKGEKKIGATEMYLAHFMGAGGAAAFLKAKDENPLQNAAVLFPEAAKANRNVFYDLETGRAKSISEVYEFFDRKFQTPSNTNKPALSLDSPTIASIKSNNTARNNVFARNNIMNGGKRSYAPAPYHALIASPIELMMLTQIDLIGSGKKPSYF